MSIEFDPGRHCGAKNRRGSRCLRSKGWGTRHRGSGRCKFHAGNTPNGRKAAAKEQATALLAALAIPVEGDPVEVLEAAVASAHGVLIGARALLKAVAEGGVDVVDATTALKVYVEAIERAGRVALGAASIRLEEQRVRVEARQVELLHQALMAAFARAEIEPAARDRVLEELGNELAPSLPAASGLN